MDQPQLGYGKQTEASIDTVNQWMRQEPWYQDQMRAWGQDPGHPTLTKSQSQQILKAAQAQGVQVDEGDMEVDDHGNFNPKGHKLRNTLIVAGLAAATIATMGAAGVFSGAAAPGAAAAAGGAETAGLGATGGVLAGLPGAGTALGGAASAVLPSAAIGTGMAGTTAGAVPTGMAGAGGTVARVGSTLAAGGSTLDKVGGLLRAAGPAIGAATTAAGQNRLDQEHLGLEANQQNISGMNAFENALASRAKLEESQRNDALKNIYRASYTKNRKPGPYNAAGMPGYSPEYLAALSRLEGEGGTTLAAPRTYDASKLPALAPYTPINIADVQGATGTKKSTLETIGDWLSPGMSTLSAASQLWRR